MKLLFSILLTIQVSAFDTQTASKIFNKIFMATIHKNTIHVYTINDEYTKVIQMAKNLHLEKNISKADILLVDSNSEVPKRNNTILFATNASVFRTNHLAIGAFYWEHGRPKIIFLKSRLEAHHITLSPSFEKYIVKVLP